MALHSFILRGTMFELFVLCQVNQRAHNHHKEAEADGEFVEVTLEGDAA